MTLSIYSTNEITYTVENNNEVLTEIIHNWIYIDVFYLAEKNEWIIVIDHSCLCVIHYSLKINV